MDNKKEIGILQELIKEIESLRASTDFFDSPYFKQWKKKTEITLRNIFGERSDNLKDFKNIRYYPLLVTTDRTPQHEIDQAYKEAYYRGLDEANAILNAMIDEIKRFGVRREKCIFRKRGTKWFTMSNPLVWLIFSLILIVISYFVYKLLK